MVRVGIDSEKPKIQRALKLSTMFDRAARATREAAIARATVEVAAAGSFVIEQGKPLAWIVVLGRGRARVERSAGEGRVVPLGYRGAGDVLGEAGLGDATVHGESAIAMEEVEIVKLAAPLVRELAAADAGLGAAILGVLLARRRETEQRIESLLFRNVESRLCEFLLKAADRWGVPSPRGVLISAPVTHLEIAQSIGSTRETVTLTIGALKKEGLLDVAGRRMILRDKERIFARVSS